MTGMYIVNPDPDDAVENTSGLTESRLDNFSEDDDEDGREEDKVIDVFPDTLTTPTTMKVTEPETEVIAVADAFAKFRRLDQQIDDDEDVPRERKPVRKITPPREEPTLFERYQQMTASSTNKTDSSAVLSPTQEMVPEADARRDTVDTGYLKMPIVAADQAQHQYQHQYQPERTHAVNESKHQLQELDSIAARQLPTSEQMHHQENERPEPGNMRTLRTRWELIDAGQVVPSNSASETNRNNPLPPSVKQSGGKLDHDGHLEERLQRTTTTDVETSNEHHPTSVAGRSSKTRQGLPSSMAFTKNRLAKFRLLESMHLEKTPEVVRHKVGCTYRCLLANILVALSACHMQ